MKHRSYHLIEFGKFLTALDCTNFLYDKERKWFSVSDEGEPVVKKVRFCERLEYRDAFGITR